MPLHAPTVGFTARRGNQDVRNLACEHCRAYALFGIIRILYNTPSFKFLLRVCFNLLLEKKTEILVVYFIVFQSGRYLGPVGAEDSWG